jgi:hypothetical protein
MTHSLVWLQVSLINTGIYEQHLVKNEDLINKELNLNSPSFIIKDEGKKTQEGNKKCC